MTTAEHLQSMTDRSKFEQLAGAILSIKFPELSNLIVGGINAKGETTKGPLDAFAKVETDQYAFIEYTTDDSNLAKKWLHDSSVPVRVSKANPKGVSTAPDGDLVKAAKYFQAIVTVEQTAKLDIYLVTNQQVDDDLWQKVMAEATTLNVSAIIIPLTTLSQFLDTNPLGHYLRYKYLNITAELPSLPLLKTIAAQNQLAYKDENFIEHDYVPRDGEERLVREYLSSGNLLTFLVADSGMGKTMIGAHLMSFYTEAGDLAIRLDPRYIETSSDVVDALFNQLNFHYKHLLPSKELLFECLAHKKILIIVDDINRIPNTRSPIDKLISWQKTQAGSVPIQVVCPLWNRNYQLIGNKDRKDQFYATVFMGPYSEREAIAALQQNPIVPILTESQAKSVAKDLKNDPLLIGLYCDSPKSRERNTSSNTMHVIKEFIDEHLNLLEQEGQHIRFESWQALTQLGHAMLRNRNFSPSLMDIRGWLKAEELAIIRSVAVQRVLIYFDSDGTIVFRHDRLRDCILSYSLSELLSGTQSNADSSSVLEEPYYAELIGQAIAQAKPAEATVEPYLSIFPLAVYTALTCLDSNDDYYMGMFQMLEEWNSTVTEEQIKPLESYEISWLLLFSDIPNVSKIIKSVDKEHFSPLARFRNGDFSGGIQHLYKWLGMEPELNDVIRDEIIDHVKQKNYSTVESLLISNLQRHFPDPNIFSAIYLLCGYWRSPAIVPHVMQCWKADPANKDKQFIYVIWAVVNSFDNKTIDELITVLEYWEQLPNDRQEKDGFFQSGPKGKILNTFRLIRSHFTKDQITILISLAEQGRFTDIVDMLLYRVDHPLAITYTVKRIGATKRLYPNTMYDTDQPDDRWRSDKSQKPISLDSWQALEVVWKNADEPIEDRKVAFRFWSDSGSSEEKLPVVMEVNTSDAMYMSIVYERVRLGDITTVPIIISMLPSNPRLIRFLKYIWSKEACDAVLPFLLSVTDEEINADEIDLLLGELINSIDRGQGIELLLRCWEKYKNRPAVVQQAFLFATPVLLQMAGDIIKQAAAPLEYFRYISLTMHNRRFFKSEPLSLAQLEGLLPYFQYIEESSLHGFAINANGQYRTWMLTNIYPLLNKEHQVYFNPSDEDILKELTEFINDNPYHVRLDRWLDDLQERNCDWVRLRRVIELFIDVEHSFVGLLVIGRCVEKKGRREDIRLLEKYSVSPETLSNPQDLVEDYAYSIKRHTLK